MRQMLWTNLLGALGLLALGALGQSQPPPMPPGPQAEAPPAIQWFATLERGLAEAQRTGKPILFVSAAPHCGGVPGIW